MTYRIVYESDYGLYHHGIKGQRWGKRRFQKPDGSLTPAGEKRYAKDLRKAEKKYSKAGDMLGRSKYYKEKGDEAEKKYLEDAKFLDKASKKYQKEGAIWRAEATRRAAEYKRAQGKKARSEYDELAQDYLARSNYLNQRADKFASKKQVDVGKRKVNSILKEASKKGYDSEKNWDDWNSNSDNAGFAEQVWNEGTR